MLAVAVERAEVLAALDADEVRHVLEQPFDVGQAHPVAAEHDRVRQVFHVAGEVGHRHALAFHALGDDADLRGDVGRNIGMKLREISDAASLPA